MKELFLALAIIFTIGFIVGFGGKLLNFFKKLFTRKQGEIEKLKNKISELESDLDFEIRAYNEAMSQLKTLRLKYEHFIEGKPRFTTNDKVVFKSRELALTDYGLKTYDGQYFTMLRVSSGDSRYIVCEDRNVYCVLESDLEWFVPKVNNEEFVEVEFNYTTCKKTGSPIGSPPEELVSELAKRGLIEVTEGQSCDDYNIEKFKIIAKKFDDE